MPIKTCIRGRKRGREETHYPFRLILVIALFFNAAAVGAQEKVAAAPPAFATLLSQYEDAEQESGNYFAASNSKLHYLAIGRESDTCILWLHGTFGDAYDFLSFAHKFRETGYRSIAVDYYGHGQTVLYQDSVSIYHLADDLQDLLVHEGISSCLVVGVSRGGMIATALYDEYPELVRGLALIDGGSVPWTINVQELPEAVAGARIGPFAVPPDTLFESREAAFHHFNYFGEPDAWKTLNRLQRLEVGNRVRWSSHYGLRQWLWERSLDQLLDGAYRPFTLPLFAASNLLVEPRVVYRNLAVPLLLIDPVKEGDWLMDFESANRELAELHPELIVHRVYPDTYHNVLFDKPDKLFEDLRAFFAKLE